MELQAKHSTALTLVEKNMEEQTPFKCVSVGQAFWSRNAGICLKVQTPEGAINLSDLCPRSIPIDDMVYLRTIRVEIQSYRNLF